MKKLIIIIISIILVKTSISQVYQPFPTSNAIWSVSNIKFAIYDDTLINSNTYQKYYYQFDTTNFTFDINKSKYFASLREYNKKIFIVPKDSLNEYLLYDFNINLNDTIEHVSYTGLAVENSEIYIDKYNNYKSVVIQIDSIQIDNDYRKRFKMKSLINTFTYDEYWIEGIGSTYGLPFTGFRLIPDYPIYNLLCFHKDNNLIYQSSNNQNCFEKLFLNVNENLNTNFDLKIFPNPFSEFFEIINENNMSEYQILLFSNEGKIIWKSTFNNEKRLVFNNINLQSGIYYLKLIKNNRVLINKKLIKM